MKRVFTLITTLSILLLTACEKPTTKEEDIEIATTNANYLQNRAPLQPKPYLELPLGAIQPKGWLLQQLEQMKEGMTGHLDELYSPVVGPRNGWLGGDGDGWGPLLDRWPAAAGLYSGRSGIER